MKEIIDFKKYPLHWIAATELRATIFCFLIVAIVILLAELLF